MLDRSSAGVAHAVGSGAQPVPRPVVAGAPTHPVGPVLYVAGFDAASLSTVRRHLRRTELSPERADDFLIAVAEIMANAVEHGGGHGTIELRQIKGWFSCDISDEGPGMPPDIHLERHAAPLDERGRGLRLVHTICEAVVHHPTLHGTWITLIVAVSPSLAGRFT